MSEREIEHTCHAEGCDTHVPPRLFMCKHHWYMVPRDLRAWVWAEYTLGQERLDGTPIRPGYFDATREAREAVAVKEGRRSGQVHGGET